VLTIVENAGAVHICIIIEFKLVKIVTISTLPRAQVFVVYDQVWPRAANICHCWQWSLKCQILKITIQYSSSRELWWRRVTSSDVKLCSTCHVTTRFWVSPCYCADDWRRETHRRSFMAVRSVLVHSGLTRVGDIRGGNWGCHPHFFWKTWRPFLLTIAFYCFYSGVTPLEGVTPHLFLPVRPRFSTILCKFAHKFFPSGVTPWRVSPGAVRPPRHPLSDATACSPLELEWKKRTKCCTMYSVQ